MPLIKVELAKGNDKHFVLALFETVQDAVQQGLRLPQDDRNIRLIEYEPEFLTLKEPYQVLVEITLFQGRSKEAKKELFRQLVGALEEKLGIPPETVFIVLNEQPLENWGLRGGIPADELKALIQGGDLKASAPVAS